MTVAKRPAPSAGALLPGGLGFGNSPGRVSAIDTAKGIGIVLVVFGHMVARDLKPLGNDWWMVWHDHLYTFHMAFFFFLSGYVFFMQPPDQWGARFKKSAAKLVPAYLLFALIVYVAKAAAVRVLHVDRPVQQPFEELLRMVCYPTEGFAQFLWFIVTLLMIYGLMVLARAWVVHRYGVVLAIAFVFHLLAVADRVPELFALHQTARYAVFFLVAAACHRYALAWGTTLLRHGLLIVGAFLVALIVLPERWLPTVAGLLSLPALVTAAMWIDRWPALRDLMQFFGRNTLTIYLMNSLAMGLVRALVLRAWDWNGWHFFVVAPFLLATGLFLPVLIQRAVFSRWKWADRITR